MAHDIWLVLPINWSPYSGICLGYLLTPFFLPKSRLCKSFCLSGVWFWKLVSNVRRSQWYAGEIAFGPNISGMITVRKKWRLWYNCTLYNTVKITTWCSPCLCNVILRLTANPYMLILYMHQFSSFLMHNLSNAPEQSRGEGFVVQLANFLIWNNSCATKWPLWRSFVDVLDKLL